MPAFDMKLSLTFREEISLEFFAYLIKEDVKNVILLLGCKS